MEVPQTPGIIQRALRWMRFWTSYPFVIAAYRLRERQRFNRNFPVRWMSQARLIAEDLEYYQPENDQQKINREFADDVLKVRAEQQSGGEKFWAVSVAILAFLAANTLNLDLSVNVFGVGFKKFAGAAELLILLSSVLTFRGAMIAGRIAILDGYLRYLVDHATDPQLRAFFMIKYTPSRYFGTYFPLNLPHIYSPKILGNITKYTGWMGILLVVVFFGIYISGVTYMLYKTWEVAALGNFTYAALVIAGASYAFSFLYSIFTLGRFPRRDYINSHKYELLEQINPVEFEAFSSSLYRESIYDRWDLEARGYLRSTEMGLPDERSVSRQFGEDNAHYPRTGDRFLRSLMSSASYSRW